MKILAEFLPILLFFLAFKFGDIYLATLTAIVTSGLQVILSRYKKGFFEKLPIMIFGIIVLLGGATLVFRNELFIKWKPTALYWTLAMVFLTVQLFNKKPLMQKLLEANIQLPSHIWQKLNLSWVLFFTVMGFLNLYVIYHFDTNTWVHFKLFGTLGLTLVFIILQGLYMAKHHKTALLEKEE